MSEIHQYNVSLAKELTARLQRVCQVYPPIEAQVEDSEGRIRNIRDVIAWDERVLVVGDAGLGKTTSVLYHASQHNGGLNLFLELNQLPHEFETEADDFIDWAVAQPRNEAYSADFFRKALHSPDTIVYLDGVDEVVDQDYAMAGMLVQSTIRAFPEPRYVVTTRPEGAARRLRKELNQYTVQEFSDETIVQFARQWTGDHLSRYMPYITDGMHQRRIEETLQELRRNMERYPYVERFAHHPAMIGTIVAKSYNFSLSGDLEDFITGRTEDDFILWAEAAREAGEDIDRFTGDRGWHIIFAFTKLAVQMHDRGTRDAPIEELARGSYWTDYRFSAEEAEQLLGSLCRHSRFMLQTKPGYAAFSFLSYQEALAAYDIMRLPPPALDAVLHTHLSEPRWNEIFLYAAGCQHQTPNEHKQVIAAIRERGSDELKQRITSFWGIDFS